MLKAGLAIAASAVAVVAIGAVVAAPLAERRLNGRHEQESTYRTGRDAKAGHASVPEWLPDDATGVRYKMRTTGGDRLLVANLKAGRPPVGCVPADEHVRPELTAGWFPKGVMHKANLKCGMYSGYADGNKFVAWQRDGGRRNADPSGPSKPSIRADR
ncbi:hypothetical protein [Streptodolium elevatio]